MTAASMTCLAALAAIVHDDADSRLADAQLAQLAQCLIDQGWRVRGLVQQRRLDARGRKGMFLIDLASAQEFCISQDLGPQSRACCVNPAGLAQASGVLRQALEERAELTIVNRFGELEAGGGGFAAELAALAGEGLPVLTAVSRKHVAAWRHFAGDAAAELPAEADALYTWWQRMAGQASAPGRAA